MAGEAEIYASALAVREVGRVPPVTRVPNSGAMLEGLANVRGQAVPIVSLPRWLGSPRAASTQKFVLLSQPQPLGLIVDGIGQITELPHVAGAARPALLRRGADDLLHPLDLGLAAESPRGGASDQRDTPRQLRSMARREERTALITFLIGGRTYGFALAETLHVMPLPDDVLPPPGADPAALGVTEWRERLLPIMNLGRLLGLEPGPARWVLVVSCRGRPLGLAVETLGPVVRLESSRLDRVPAAINRGSAEAQVSAIARPPGGGLIAVLSTAQLFDADRLAAMSGQPEQFRGQAAAQSAHAAYLLFRLGDETYGLSLEGVEGVAACPTSLSRVPGAPDFVLGLIDHRGEALPVIDQRARLAVPSAVPQAACGALILTRLAGRLAGLRVDAVLGVRQIETSLIEGAAEGAGASTGFTKVSCAEDGHLVLLASPDDLLAAAERDLLKRHLTGSAAS